MVKLTRRSSGDASRLNHSALRRSALRFGRNTLGPVLPVGAPPSRAQPGPHREDWPHRENWALPALGAHAIHHGLLSPRPVSVVVSSLWTKSRGPVLPVGAPPSRAFSAGPPPGGLAPPGELGLPALGAHASSTTGWYQRAPFWSLSAAGGQSAHATLPTGCQGGGFTGRKVSLCPSSAFGCTRFGSAGCSCRCGAIPHPSSSRPYNEVQVLL